LVKARFHGIQGAVADVKPEGTLSGWDVAGSQGKFRGPAVVYMYEAAADQ